MDPQLAIDALELTLDGMHDPVTSDFSDDAIGCLSQDESGPRPALGESSLKASSVDVLVEPALRIAGGESRGIALEDVEAVSGGLVPGGKPRARGPGIRPSHVDPTPDRAGAD